MKDWEHFKLEYGTDPNSRGGGRWYASTVDGNYDAAGETPIDAMAELIIVLHNALLDAQARIQ